MGNSAFEVPQGLPGADAAVATDAIWDAKGDLAGGTGADTAARLAVGTNGQVLTADSAETTGLKWAAAAGGGSLAVFPGLPSGAFVRGYTFDSTVESWTTDNNTLSATGGKLRLAGTSAGIALEPTGAGNQADGELVMDIAFGTMGGSSSMGLVFRATDRNDHYLWIISADPAAIDLFKCTSGSYNEIGNSVFSGSILPKAGTGQKHRYMVRFDGSVLSLYIDGTLVSSIVDSTHTTGIIGFRMDGQGTTSTVDVDNVSVYGTPDLVTGNVVVP